MNRISMEVKKIFKFEAFIEETSDTLRVELKKV